PHILVNVAVDIAVVFRQGFRPCLLLPELALFLRNVFEIEILVKELKQSAHRCTSFSSLIFDAMNSHFAQNRLNSSRPASLSAKNFRGGPRSDGFFSTSTSWFFSSRTRMVYTVPSTTSVNPTACT